MRLFASLRSKTACATPGLLWEKFSFIHVHPTASKDDSLSVPLHVHTRHLSAFKASKLPFPCSSPTSSAQQTRDPWRSLSALLFESFARSCPPSSATRKQGEPWQEPGRADPGGQHPPDIPQSRLAFAHLISSQILTTKLHHCLFHLLLLRQ